MLSSSFFIHRLAVLSCLALYAGLSTAEARSAAPNIVLFLADDLGWADVGFHNSEIRTPHIDSLAERGATLDQFYVQPTCTPTRIALMTGRYPFRCGGHIRVLRAHHKHGAAPDDRFLSEALHDVGYTTAITGKWHLGLARRAYWPASRGFDIQYGHLGGAIDYFSHTGYGSLDWYDTNQMPLQEEGYSTDLIGAKACEIVKQHPFDSHPLFLYVPFNAPHTPRQAKEKDVAEYAHIKNKARRIHAAMVTAMDRQMGAVLDALEQRGVSDDTLVIFASDNGGYEDAAKNAPLRGHKGTLYEGGVRVPACMRWPGQLEPGTVVSQSIHIVDLFPTLVGLAQGDADAGQPLDGVDVWAAIHDGDQLAPRDIIHNVFDASGRGAIRRGDWKLIVQPQHASEGGISLEQADLFAELYNVAEDPYEQNDLAGRSRELAMELWETLKLHGKEVGDSRPYGQQAPPGWKGPADWSQAPD